MTKTIIAAVLLTTSIVSHANDDDACSVLYDFARIIMTERQKGISIVQIRKLTNNMVVAKAGNDKGVIGELLMGIITTAYEQPRFSTEENQQNAISNFANAAATTCYRELEN